jgi:hypothetical protein
MDNLPRSCRQSEKHLLPHPRCEHCGQPIRPKWRDASGTHEDTVDPVGTVLYRCQTIDCKGNRPF